MTRRSLWVFLFLAGVSLPRLSEGALPATDDFERHSLGPNWTVLAGSGSMGLVSNSDLGLIQGPARGGAVAWAADMLPADQFSEAVIAGDRPDSMLTQVFLRLRTADGARYGFHWNNGFGGRWEIKYDGVPTAQTRILASTIGPEPLPGDTIRAEIVGQTIRCFHNGVLLLSATDTEPQAITSAGQAGMVFRFTTTVSAFYPATAFESWSGGPMGVTSVSEDPKALVTLLSVYPHPMTTRATVTLSQNIVSLQNASLRLIDVNGRTVLRWGTLSSRSLSIDLNGRAPGVYFLRLEEAGRPRAIRRLVVL